MYNADATEDTEINTTLSLALQGFVPMGIVTEKSCKASINYTIRGSSQGSQGVQERPHSWKAHERPNGRRDA